MPLLHTEEPDISCVDDRRGAIKKIKVKVVLFVCGTFIDNALENVVS